MRKIIHFRWHGCLCAAERLRYGVADNNDRLIQYHDFECIQDEEYGHGFMYIDDFILDGKR